jgi:hypothetical protein
MDCDACESPMEKVHDICKLDGNRWLCGHIKCKTTKSARVGTWFEKSKLTHKQALTSYTPRIRGTFKVTQILMQG